MLRCCLIAGSPQHFVKLPGWQFAHTHFMYLPVLPKNTKLLPQPGLKPRSINSETIAQTITPTCLPFYTFKNRILHFVNWCFLLTVYGFSQVGYFTGSNQQHLPASIMSDLDDVLVPVIHSAANHQRWRSLSIELLFKVLRLLWQIIITTCW